MTESQWLQCTSVDDLYLDRLASTPRPMRKLQLYACGCCRRIWEYIKDVRCRNAVEVAELYIDGLATEEQFDVAFDAVEQACDEIIKGYPESVEQIAAYAAQMAIRAPSDVAFPVASVLSLVQTPGGGAESLNRHLVALMDLFRDVFGNPYRAPNLHQFWLAAEVKSLAQLIYDQRAFFRMYELAESLEEAGCRDPELLDHCRSREIHVKGCWVVDLLLGKDPSEKGSVSVHD
jgi:hypothetical protein